MIAVRVFLTGASGVMGRASITALLGEGHDVIGLVRTRTAARRVSALGAEPAFASLFEVDSLVRVMQGCDAIANLATKVPVGTGALKPGSLREIDRIRIHGSRAVARAAMDTGIGRIVQHSLSFIYADAADDWIDENSLIDVSSATEPVVVAEDRMNDFRQTGGGEAVCLRFGLIVGQDANTRWQLHRAAAGRRFVLGDPQSWMHVVHPSDIGSAVCAALTAPSGIYNIGAEPVRRGDFAALLAQVAGGPDPRALPAWVERVGAEKLEILTRSQRISSRKFSDATGWVPQYGELSEEWLRESSREKEEVTPGE